MAWLGSARLSTAQHGSVRLSLHFLIVALPLLPWLLKNFFIPRRSIKLSLDPLLGYQREEHLYFLNRQRNSHFLVVKKRCAHSKQLHSIIRWLCWFKSSGSVVSNVASSQWRFSPANQWSAEFTRHVLITVRFAWNLSRGGTEKSTRYPHILFLAYNMVGKCAILDAAIEWCTHKDSHFSPPTCITIQNSLLHVVWMCTHNHHILRKIHPLLLFNPHKS